MPHRTTSLPRRAAYGLACALALTLPACSGGGDAAAPNDDPPGQEPGPNPGQDPGPHDPGPQQPDPQDPDQPAGIIGTYTLVQINSSKPGQLVTIANPDGVVIGLYRFNQATSLSLDALQTFALNLQYTDDKSQFELSDEGEFKQAGSAGGSLALTFTSATWGDAFSAIATDGVVAINYDFNGDGQTDTVFAFQRVGD
jgi:hypothetical protein